MAVKEAAKINVKAVVKADVMLIALFRAIGLAKIHVKERVRVVVLVGMSHI